jgi:ribosomal protein L7Ae-like RNA K-turn-binding protein
MNQGCLRSALKQKQFNRAFKREVSVLSPDEMAGQVSGIMRKRLLGYIGLANRAGQIISGGSMVCDAIRGGHKPGLVLLATDVSESIGNKIEQLAAVHHITCMRVVGKDEFGAILGKAPRSAIAVRAGGFVAQIRHEIERYRNFLGEVQSYE